VIVSGLTIYSIMLYICVIVYVFVLVTRLQGNKYIT